MSQHLYRWFDSGGVLLYVGISTNAYTRAKQHAAQSAWWPEAHTMTLEVFTTREAVRQAEILAIKAEKPKYNVQHTDRDRRVSAASRISDAEKLGRWVIPGAYATGERWLPLEVVGDANDSQYVIREYHPRTFEFVTRTRWKDMVRGGKGTFSAPVPRVFRSRVAWERAVMRTDWVSPDADWLDIVEQLHSRTPDDAELREKLTRMVTERVYLASRHRKYPRAFDPAGVSPRIQDLQWALLEANLFLQKQGAD